MPEAGEIILRLWRQNPAEPEKHETELIAMTARTGVKTPSLKLPEKYQRLKSLHGDPPMSVPFGYMTESMESFLMLSPIPPEDAMPFHDPHEVIHGIHLELAENQGLIEVGSGITRTQRRYIYSVVKTLKKIRGVQYTLAMNIEMEGTVLQVHGFFSEGKVAGARDAMVYAWLANQGEVRLCERGIDGWAADPYDPFFTFGVLMNRSEQPQYDNLFPNHPLSELRRFVREVIAEN